MKGKKSVLEPKAIIGTIHLFPTPSSPDWKGDIKELYKNCIEQAEIFYENGINGLIIENTFDAPYEKSPIHPATVSTTAVALEKIKNIVDCPLGVQILAGGNIESLSVAVSLELDFIRVEGFAFGHIADEGFIDASGPEILRWKNYLKNQNIKIFADIKKKHSSHSVTRDISLLEMAKAIEFMRGDGVVITGKKTGEPPSLNSLKNITKEIKIPVIIGSGINRENLADYFELADYFIVGSYFKNDSDWRKELIPKKIRDLALLRDKLLKG